MACVANVKVDELGDVVKEMLEEYGTAIAEKTRDIIRDAGAAALVEAKNKAPVYHGPERKNKRKPGTYRNSLKLTYSRKEAGASAWSSKTDAGYALVYASGKEYRLTHLLENGHALRQGGRARGVTHWSDAEQKAEEILDRDINKLSGVT